MGADGKVLSTSPVFRPYQDPFQGSIWIGSERQTERVRRGNEAGIRRRTRVGEVEGAQETKEFPLVWIIPKLCSSPPLQARKSPQYAARSRGRAEDEGRALGIAWFARTFRFRAEAETEVPGNRQPHLCRASEVTAHTDNRPDVESTTTPDTKPYPTIDLCQEARAVKTVEASQV